MDDNPGRIIHDPVWKDPRPKATQMRSLHNHTKDNTAFAWFLWGAMMEQITGALRRVTGEAWPCFLFVQKGRCGRRRSGAYLKLHLSLPIR